MELLAHRFQDREIHQFAKTLRQVGRLRLLRPCLHEGTSTNFSGNEPSSDQFVVGAADGLHGKFQVVGELAMRQQARPVRQMPFLDGAGDLLGEGEIGRPAQLGYVGSPICHDFDSAQNQFN